MRENMEDQTWPEEPCSSFWEEVRNFCLTIIGDPSQSTVVRECKESFRRMIDEQPTVHVIKE